MRTKRLKRAEATNTRPLAAAVTLARRNVTMVPPTRINRVAEDPFRGILGGGRNQRRRQNASRSSVATVRVGSRGINNFTSTTRSGRPRTTPSRPTSPPSARRLTPVPTIVGVRVRPTPVTQRRRIGLAPAVTPGPLRNSTTANQAATTRPPYIMGWAPGGK